MDFPNRTDCVAKIAAIDSTVIRAIDSESWLEAYPEEQEIFLYGEIGAKRWGAIDGASVKDALKQCGDKPVTLYFTSPGGSVDEGVAIYNAIANHKQGVTVVVDAMAASIASYILMAGTKRIVYGNSVVMIHNPWTSLAGDAEELRKSAELLDRYGDRLLDAYATASGHSRQEIRRMMDAETWFFGEEIVDAGFADELVPTGRSAIAAAASPKRRVALAKIARCKAMMALA